ncbi:MAG TPA: J domain-containing protein [Polyangia bacterium]|jgi:DnaJ-class molecular chaperone with C-terminal Zn finger domain|nr:J domain-containing protein [Polyangia bacterium]
MTSRTELDPYSVLGVARTASDSEIRAAYHALVAKYHPDRYQGNPLEDLANEKLVAINRAYEILSDRARRAAYDSGPGFASGQVYATAPGSLTRKQIRWLQIVALLLMLPLAFRFGSILVRFVVQILRGALEITKLMRGTPLAGVLVLLAIALLVLLLVRHRRAKRKS